MPVGVDHSLIHFDKATTKSGCQSFQTQVVELSSAPPETDVYSTLSESKLETNGQVAAILFPFPPPSNTSLLEVLPEDKKTPDNHVPRDPRLIRLTGIHPFNAEPPLSELFNEGFLTSPELFFVRSHGAVPQVYNEEIPDWEISFEGHVKRPFKLTLRQLIEQYEQITVPITMVCAGNRRKEQNQVRKSKGFSWGAAGISTALWTGVHLSELIKRAMPKMGARYVCMEGADKLPNGCYGSSVKLNWVLDSNRGIMLAYGMNGEILTPDHGKPLRVVVPGQIGARSVKWLKKIIVTQVPSDNWYHIYDNRVLPTMVSPEESANDDSWWIDDRYAIYDLSTNSAVAYPAHDEKISIAHGASEFYKAKGYAYSGGGRRVTRVEITLDKGKSWLLANIKYYEDTYRDHTDENQTLFGGRLDVSWRVTCFCWCFWELDIPVGKLKDSSDLMVRAMDESMNIQPRDMYWSVLGMMNNPWFRVTITREDDHLHFEHPNQPALIPGGWMEKVTKRGGNLANGFWGENMTGEVENLVEEIKKEIKMTKDGLKKEISIEGLKEHEGESEPWFVLNGEVYDGTPFLEGHPGGATSITSAAGQDATDEFMAIHSETAKLMMEEYHIGTLTPSALEALTNPSISEPLTENDSSREVFLQSKQWTKATLSTRKKVSSDARVFSFTLDYQTQKIGMQVGQHLMLRLRDPVTREIIIRPYTPLSLPSQLGTLDILIKIYFPIEARGIQGGKMTTALEEIPIGHSVEFKGPIGKFTYHGHGHCTISHKSRTVKRFFMICGGSGITPLFQVLRTVLADEGDKTKCVLVDANKTEEDILCREELGALAKREDQSGRFRLVQVLSYADQEWKGLRGRVGKELLEAEIGKRINYSREKEVPDDVLVLICGPEPMEVSVRAELNEMGWGGDDLLFF